MIISKRNDPSPPSSSISLFRIEGTLSRDSTIRNSSSRSDSPSPPFAASLFFGNLVLSALLGNFPSNLAHFEIFPLSYSSSSFKIASQISPDNNLNVRGAEKGARKEKKKERKERKRFTKAAAISGRKHPRNVGTGHTGNGSGVDLKRGPASQR